MASRSVQCEVHAFGFEGWSERFGYGGEQVSGAELVGIQARLAGFDAGEEAEVICEAFEAAQLTVGGAGELRVLEHTVLESVDVTTQAGEGRAELVGGVGHELDAAFLAVL